MFSRDHSTIRSQLTTLVLSCVVPVWLAAGFLVWHAYSTKRHQVLSHMQDSTQAMTMVVDRELSSVKAALQALATSSAFARGDFAEVHRQARELLGHYPGADIIVADATGQQVVNSYRPYGEPLPKRKSVETLRAVFETGKPVVSDLFFGAVTRRPMIGIDIPVLVDGKVAYDLAMTFPCDRLGATLKGLALPGDWFVSVLDGKQVLVARSRKPERYVGSKATPAIREAVSRAPEGTTEHNNLEGMRVLTTFKRSALSNWTVVIGVSKAAVMAEIYLWMAWAVAGATVISAIGVLLALGIARRTAREIQALVQPALAIGRGEPVPELEGLSVKEPREVAAALVQASRLLQHRAVERDDAERELMHTIELLQAETAQRLRSADALVEKERLLIQQSRQAAMGEMIGNIAHQWRQPLNTLGLTIQNMELVYEMGDFNGEFLSQSVTNSMNLIQHMSRTISDFSNYFRPDKEKAEFKVHQAVQRTVALVQDSFASDQIALEVQAQADPVILGYPNEFAQVLLNLLVNAKDAMAEIPPELRRIQVAISCAGGRAVVSVTDSAGGVPEEIMDKIFDPYFTTKGPQKGTGVGLFMSKAIIEKNMGGSLTVRNVEGGAQFRIEV